MYTCENCGFETEENYHWCRNIKSLPEVVSKEKELLSEIYQAGIEIHSKSLEGRVSESELLIKIGYMTGVASRGLKQ